MKGPPARGRRRKRSFRQQLMTAIGAIITVTFLLFLLAFHKVKEIMASQYSDLAERSVEAAADKLDYTLQDVENLSSSILFNHDLMDSLKTGDKSQFESRLNSYFNSSFSIEGIYAYTPSGYRYVGANILNGQADFPREELDETTGEIIWFPTREVNVSVLSGRIPQNYFSMGRKIVDINSLKTLGYMTLEMDEQVLREAYGRLYEDGSRILISDSRGNLISDSDGFGEDRRADGHAFMNSILSGDSVGTLEYQEAGRSWVAIYAPFNHGRWRLVKTIPKNVLYSRVNRLQISVMVGAAVFMFAMLVAAFFYSRQLTMPITRMIRQMKKVEEGNLEVRVDMDAGNELGNLGESFNHMLQRVEVLMDEVVAAERKKNEMELEVLHAQINPHFLYNTLNTIRWMAKIKGEDSISGAILALIRLLRVSISLGKNTITLKEEVGYIDNYLLIQRLRFNQQFEIGYGILPEHERLMIPKLILQPIVENSLIYGIDELEEGAEKGLLLIRIYTRPLGSDVEIVVEDNGPGMEPEVLERVLKDEKDDNKFSTVGLNNVNQRIKMYFGKGYGLRIDSAPGKGTLVVILVPGIRTEQ